MLLKRHCLHYKKKHTDLLFSVQKNTDNFNAKMRNTKNGRMMLLTQCEVCGNTKSRFIAKDKQKAEGLLSSLGIRTPLIKAPLSNVLL